VINKVKKMFVYNVNENMNMCSAMHVRSMLLRIMILTVQETHLNEVYFLRNKISQLKLIILKRTDVETLTHKNHNIVKK